MTQLDNAERKIPLTPPIKIEAPVGWVHVIGPVAGLMSEI